MDSAVEADGAAAVGAEVDAAFGEAGSAVAVEAVADQAVEVDRSAGAVDDPDELAEVVGDRAVIGDVAVAAVDVEGGPGRVGDRRVRAEAERSVGAGVDVDAGIAAVERRRAVEIVGSVGVGELQAGAVGGA